MSIALSADFLRQIEMWRQHLHARPEIAFEERETADFVAGKLSDWGLTVERGLAGTGVVGLLENGPGPMIGLRADLDCVSGTEATGLDYASRNAGRMHACGHDGHMSMLLGAARVLSIRKRFSGSIAFIFQPGEENVGGGRVMVEDGLFERFPVERVFGMHNWPDLPLGSVAVRPGPMMAAYDAFDITVTGKGCHAGMPDKGVDPIPAASAIVTALQTLVSRTLDPLDAGVVSITAVNGGDSHNVIPEVVTLKGCVRWFREETGERLQAGVKRIVEAVAAAHGCVGATDYECRYPPTLNDPEQARFCQTVAASAFGDASVVTDGNPSMGAEDFAFMLREKPGCYVWLGTKEEGREMKLHSPHYDFNDNALAYGIRYWVALAEGALPA